MYTESRESPRARQLIFTSGGCLLAVCILCLWAGGRLPHGLLLRLCALAGAGAVFHLVLRFGLRRYTYALQDDALILQWQLGGHSPHSLRIPLSGIIALAPRGQVEERGRSRTDYRFSFLAEDAVLALAHRDGDRTCVTLFQPSEELLCRLRAALAAPRDKHTDLEDGHV